MKEWIKEVGHAVMRVILNALLSLIGMPPEQRAARQAKRAAKKEARKVKRENRKQINKGV